MISRRDLLTSLSAAGALAVTARSPFAQAGGVLPMVFPWSYVESQGWWQPQSGHIHLTVAAPVGQVVSGVLPLDLRLTLHQSDIAIENLSLRIINHYTARSFYRYPVSLTPTSPTSIDAWDVHFDLDTRIYKDGWRYVWLEAFGAGPLNELKTVLRFAMYVQNAQEQAPMDGVLDPAFKHGPQSLTGIEGNGWPGAIGFNYQRVFWEDVPRRPVSGRFRPRVKCDTFPTCRLIVELDTTHEIPATKLWPHQPMTMGQTLFDSTGYFYEWMALDLDTTQLTDGWHWLTARHERTRDAGPNGDLSSGVAKFWFYVDNAHGPRSAFSVAY